MGTGWCYQNPGAEWRPTQGGESRTKCTRPPSPAKSISCWDNYKQMESLQREIESNMKGHHTASSVLGKKPTVLQGKKSLTSVRHKLAPRHSGPWNTVLSLLTSTTKGKKIVSILVTVHNITTPCLGRQNNHFIMLTASTWKTQRPWIT